jgi:Kinesin motor domain
VRASYLEIYNEEIRDLLSRSPQARLELKEHPDRGVYVRDLMQFVVKSAAEISSVLQVRAHMHTTTDLAQRMAWHDAAPLLSILLMT